MSNTITLRNLDERTQIAIRHRAVDHGRSMEAEIRAVLTDYATRPVEMSTSSPLFDAAASFRSSVGDIDLRLDRVLDQQREVFL